MTRVINVCNGWACPLVTRCARSDFNMEDNPPGVGWVRHYQADPVGERCADFVPIRYQTWGEGKEVCD